MTDSIAACDSATCSGLTPEQVLESLGTSEAGLTSVEATKRLEQYGPNEIREIKGRRKVV